MSPPAAGEVAELVQWLRRMAGAGLGGYDELNADRAADLLERLASPPSDGPSDEEVLKEAANALGYEYTPAWFETRGGALEAYPHELIDFARVITRYARPAPAPISVSERLPGPEDCDELWDVMVDAYMRGRQRGYGFGYAAEIEALADVVVPEEPPVERSRHTMNRWVRRDERQTIRAVLLDAARRAREAQP